MISWLLFGVLAVPDIAADWDWRIGLYAVLSLTVIRILPVVSHCWARMDWSTVFFIGWFGPRGLASIVFALIALEELQGLPGPIDEIVEPESGVGSTSLRLSAVTRPIATKKMGVEMAAARAAIIPTQKSPQTPAKTLPCPRLISPHSIGRGLLALTGRVMESTMIRSDRLSSTAGVEPIRTSRVILRRIDCEKSGADSYAGTITVGHWA
jgi:hypothetical protein